MKRALLAAVILMVGCGGDNSLTGPGGSLVFEGNYRLTLTASRACGMTGASWTGTVRLTQSMTGAIATTLAGSDIHLTLDESPVDAGQFTGVILFNPPGIDYTWGGLVVGTGSGAGGGRGQIVGNVEGDVETRDWSRACNAADHGFSLVPQG